MKNIRLIGLLLILINASAFGQNQNIPSFTDVETWSKNTRDSLHLELSQADNDSSKYQALLNLWLHYYEYNVDSSIFYLDNMIELLRHQGFRSSEGQLNLNKGHMYAYKGEYQKSLEYILRGQDIIEDPKTSIDPIARTTSPNKTDDVVRMIQRSEVKRFMGQLFWHVGNYRTSLSSLKEAKKEYKKLGEVDGLFYSQLNIAKAYMSLNELDSALATINEALRLEISDIAYNWLGTALATKGSIQFNQNKYKEAEITYLKALEINLSNLNYSATASTQNGLAELNLLTNRPDEGKKYALDAIQNAKIFNAQNEIANSYNIISRAYAVQNNVDSSYHYLHLANALKDSLQNIEKENIRKFNATLLNENLRNKDQMAERDALQSRRRTYGLITALFVFFIIAFLLYRNNRQKQKANELLHSQKEEIAIQKHKAESALEDLKATQSQLIQSEKMASLGELTAGIAHEIQNPLNFVNNFSEVNSELVEELKGILKKGDIREVEEIVNDIDTNLDKISHHGQRASEIVKGMLQHSRTGEGQKEPTDINALADEYLRLAYHGLRAKDKSFNAEFQTVLDPSLPKVNVIPQDIGRVLLNLINNAFFAVNQKANRHSERSEESENYQPKVVVSTRQFDGKIEISVKDNGSGIPTKIKDKIFQPFFTTKPTGSGTGLGLSLSYDIVKAHGGGLKVDSKEGEQTEFIIQLPVNNH